MSSTQRRGLVGIVLPVAAIGAGIFLNNGIAEFDRTFGPEIRALEGYELASDYATTAAQNHFRQAGKDLSAASEDERAHKLMNVSLTSSESLKQDGQQYERLNNDSFLNEVIYPIHSALNPRLSPSITSVLGYSTSEQVMLPLGYTLGYSTIGLGLISLGQAALAVRKRR